MAYNFSNLKAFMDGLTEGVFPGNSIVVYKDGEKVFSYQSGYADLENKIPMQGGELFNIYSCTKPATAVAALQLYEKGLFLLDDPLYDFIPEYRHMQVRLPNGDVEEARSPITLTFDPIVTVPMIGLVFSSSRKNWLSPRFMHL